MKKITYFLTGAAGFTALAACSAEDPVHPEETLEPYLEAWSTGNFSEMSDYISDEALTEIDGFDWEFEERYETIYDALSLDLEINFEERDFEEEEEDLEELEEISYPVDVTMTTAAGDISYEASVDLEKITDEEEETEEWVVHWETDHFMPGMEDPHDEISMETVEPVRGEIFDRNGEPLAVNGEIYEAGIVPDAADDPEEAAREMAEVLEIDEDAAVERALQYEDNPDWFAPVQQLALTDERTEELLDISGVQLSELEGREYPYGDTTGHVIGHIGAVNAEELEEYDGYTSSSEIGKNGMELVLEEELRGSPGMTVAVVDDEGETREVLLEEEAVDGEDVTLTLDASMQEDVAGILEDDSGAGVVQDPETGEVLVLASEPAFDSNLRYLGLPDPRAEELDTTDVLFERRFQGTYSPGSIFKPFTAAIGLEEETLDPDEELTIEGEQWQADESWGGYQITRVNDAENVDLSTAMKQSDNIYFARQALDIGSETMESWAETLGFGEDFPFDFPLHTSQIANDGLEQEELLADTGYGQGEVEISPVHINALYSAFLNDGDVTMPVLVQEEEREVETQELFQPETAETVRETLREVVAEDDGTANRDDTPGELAGKTGTAELKSDQTVEDGDQIGWYTSFDNENENYVVTIMIQNAEDRGGSGYAVDLANEFWERVE